MIQVRYRGRLGNQLFQYCFGRILATRLGYELKADRIAGFPSTSEVVSGRAYLTPRVVLGGHSVDIPSLVAEARHRCFALEGFFQRYEYYHPYRDIIRSHWLRMAPVENTQALLPRPDDLVLTVRRGDYVQRPGYALPFEFYEEAIERTRWTRLLICTDDPEDPLFSGFEKYRPLMFRGSALDQLRFLRGASQIVLSQSSFSWWAAFLSDAEHIVFPVPNKGLWSPERPEIDLRVDEPRYKYLPVPSGSES